MLARPAAPPPPYFPALTGLRAVAAYLVFFHHFRPEWLPAGWAQRFVSQWYVGVSLFFVLSGFVIAARYQGSAQLTGPWLRRYFWRRFARIYPVYFLLNGLALFSVYWPLRPETAANSLVLMGLSQSLLRGFSRTLKFVGLPQGWSLTVEECFYFSAPLLLGLWRRRGWPGALAFGAGMLGLGLLLTHLCAGRPGLHGLFGSYHHLFNYTFFGRVLEFLLGAGLARAWAARPGPATPGRWPGRWPWRTAAGALACGLTVHALAQLRTPTGWSDWYDGLLPPAAIGLHLVVFPLGATLLLAGLLREASGLRRLLASPLAQRLGQGSYFFYLFHLGPLSRWWEAQFGVGRHVLGLFGLTVVLAELGHRLLEEPLRRWVLRRAGVAPAAG